MNQRIKGHLVGLRAKRKFNLLDDGDTRAIWQDWGKDGHGYHGDQYGQAQCYGTVKATGRARCRYCGEKIAKGLDCFDLYVSFTDGGYNPWTATVGRLHMQQDCPKAQASTT